MGAIQLTVLRFVLYAIGFALLAKVWLGATWRAGYRLHRPDRPDVPVAAPADRAGSPRHQ